jgi:hypothetical protein
MRNGRLVLAWVLAGVTVLPFGLYAAGCTPSATPPVGAPTPVPDPTRGGEGSMESVFHPPVDGGTADGGK